MSVIASKYLATNVNRLAQGPDTLLRALNVVNDDGQLRPRRGQDLLPRNDKPFLYLGSSVADNFKPIKTFFYNNRVWVYWRNDTDQYDGIGYYDFDTTVWRFSLLTYRGNADYASFLPQLIESDRRLLFASSSGVLSSPKLDTDEYTGSNLDTIQTTLYKAGVMRALPFFSALTVDLTAYANNWLPNAAKVAYVHVWKKINTNGTIVYGPPSSRVVVTNSAGAARGVELKVQIPLEIIDAYSAAPGDAARYSCEIYRTYTSNPDGTGTAPDPGANYYLALEIRPTTSELSTSYLMVVDDMQADVTLQDPLYTNETEEGAINERTRPPMCKTLANFQNCTWFGNSTSLWRNFFNIQAVMDGAAANKNGIRTNDVIIVGDWAFEAVTGAPSAWQFKIDTTTGYAAQISRVLNSTSSLIAQYNNNHYATRFNLHAISGPDDFVGKMMLEERFAGSAGTIKPYIGLYRTNGYASTSDAVPVSPVPLVSDSVGKGYRILRVQTLAIGGDVQITLDTAAYAIDFTVGDTLNVARIPGDQSVWALLPQGQYVVKNIAGAVVTLVGVTGGAILNYQTGVAPYGAYNLLGAVHCVIDKSTGAVSQGVGDQDKNPHRAHYSTPGEPESSPLLNYFDFGSADKSIIAMVPMSGSLFVFKEDGLFRIQGYYPDFYSSLFDQNVTILGPDCVTQMNGLLYALTTKGIYEISEQGAKRISFDIQNELDYILWNNQQNARVNSFLVANQSDQRLMVWIPNVGSTKPDTCYVFDGFGWTKRSDSANYACSGVRTDTSNDQMRLYTVKNHFGGWLTIERKTATYNDYSDEQLFPTACAQVNATTINVTFATASNMCPLDTTWSNKFIGAVVTSNNKAKTRGIVTGVTYNGSNQFKFVLDFYDGSDTNAWSSFAPGDIRIYLPITTEVMFNISADSPEQRKHWSEVQFFFNQPMFTKMDSGFATDVNPTLTYTTSDIKGFAEGLFPDIAKWAILTDNCPIAGKTIKRQVPVPHARGSQLRVALKHSRAWEFYSLYGFATRENTGGSNIERNNNL